MISPIRRSVARLTYSLFMSVAWNGAPLVVSADEPQAPKRIEINNILIIGDSISIRYTPIVAQELQDLDGSIRHAPGNSRETTYALAKPNLKDYPKFSKSQQYSWRKVQMEQAKSNLDFWLAFGRWDVIVFNFGLHDIKRSRKPDQPPQTRTSIEQYKSNLETICARLKQTDAKLIWVKTTPVRPPANYDRQNTDVIRFNAAATEVLESQKIPMVDLYTPTFAELDRYIAKDGTHFQPVGVEMQGRLVAQAIRTRLED